MLNRRSAIVGMVAACLVGRGRAQSVDIDALIATIESGKAFYPGASGQIEAKELLRTTFAAAQPQQGKSQRAMTDRTTRLIAAFEVSNRQRYEEQYQTPVCPDGDSGVTIGIGYDLGYVGEYVAVARVNRVQPNPGRAGHSIATLTDHLEFPTMVH